MSHAVVHLVRHGEVENPHRVLYGRLPGYELSERGHAMARLVAKHFAEQKEHGTNFVSLVSSPLIRAQQTADPIAQTLGLPVTTEPGVIEAESQLEGYSNIKDTLLSTPRLWPLVRNPLTPSWGEPYAHQATRMAQAISKHRDHAIQQHGPGANIVVVSHQLPIWVTRLATEGRSLSLNAFRRECTLASVTSISFDRNGNAVDLTYSEPAAELLPGTINVPGA